MLPVDCHLWLFLVIRMGWSSMLLLQGFCLIEDQHLVMILRVRASGIVFVAIRLLFRFVYLVILRSLLLSVVFTRLDMLCLML